MLTALLCCTTLLALAARNLIARFAALLASSSVNFGNVLFGEAFGRHIGSCIVASQLLEISLFFLGFGFLLLS